MGCKLNYKSDIKQELQIRKAACNQIWKKLENFWKHSNTDNRVKLQVYNAVITSKLLYGLESANLTPGLKKSLDVFQARGIRQILKLDTTWAQIKNGKKADNTLEKIYKEASKALNPRIDTLNYWRYFWDRVERTVEESGLLKNINDALITDKREIHIYTDGSCSKDNKWAGWGMVVTKPAENNLEPEKYYAPITTNFRNPESLGNNRKTNNTAELTGIARALEYICEIKMPENAKITIRYDSKMAANMARGIWKPKANAELIENVKTLRKNAEDIVGEITFEHVKSHIGIKYNEMADDCAVLGAAGCEQVWPKVRRKPLGPEFQNSFSKRPRF